MKDSFLKRVPKLLKITTNQQGFCRNLRQKVKKIDFGSRFFRAKA